MLSILKKPMVKPIVSRKMCVPKCQSHTVVLNKDVILTQQAVDMVKLALDYNAFAAIGMVPKTSAYYKSMVDTYKVLLDEIDDPCIKDALKDKLKFVENLKGL